MDGRGVSWGFLAIVEARATMWYGTLPSYSNTEMSFRCKNSQVARMQISMPQWRDRGVGWGDGGPVCLSVRWYQLGMCQPTHSLQAEPLPHFWPTLEFENCFQMCSGADFLSDESGFFGSLARWVFWAVPQTVSGARGHALLLSMLVLP